MSTATLFYTELKKYSQPIGSLPVLLGVSGGVDSMVLMHLAHNFGVSAIVAHVNYHMRQPDSDLDARLVESEARKYGFKVLVANASPEMLKSGNFQDNAREFRHTFFQKVAAKEHCSAILLGHHREDQIETIMQKWFRGAGLHALSGMSVYDSESAIMRPLLNISKTEIHQYATENNISFREDSSNRSNNYARNWLRNTFFNKLEGFFPGWQKNVLDSAERASTYDEITRALVDKFAAASGMEITLSDLQPFSQSAQMLLISTWLKKNDIAFSAGQLDMIVRLIETNPGAKVPINNGFAIWRNRSNLQLKRSSLESDSRNDSTLTHLNSKTENKPAQEEGEDAVNDENRDLTQGTSSTIGNGLIRNHKVQICQHENASIDMHKYSFEAKFLTKEEECKFGDGKLYLCSELISYPITVRRWESGDRLNPFGMTGSMLVSDLLTNRKIASAQKKEANVLVSFDARICAVIFPHPTERGDVGCIDNEFRLKTPYQSRLELTINYTV